MVDRAMVHASDVDPCASPYARLRPVPVTNVEFADDFWAPRLRRNRDSTLPSQHELLESTGRLDNFRRAAGQRNGPFQGVYFNDSDVYKWVEAAAWSLAGTPDPDLARTVDAVVADIAAAQRQDGYLNSYFALDRADERWTNPDLHELYCAGHLFQAAVAHHRATGGNSLLEVATRFADHVNGTLGPPELDKRPWLDGHPEVEMALVELYRTTGRRRYLTQAAYFLDARGHGTLGRPYDRFDPEYHQDHRPFRELDEIVGHAVRAVYLNCGAADLVAETGDPALRAALDRLWGNMTRRKTYVSGGLGARYEGESFGADFELPNGRAYAETCAAIGSVMWAWRMLGLTGDAEYADAMDRALYNGVLSGLSLDGQSYFYQNPLADDGGHRRQPWFGIACCPPNLARLLASLPGYVASSDDAGLWLHLYATGSLRTTLPSGECVVEQRTRYPWDGAIDLEVLASGTFALRLRIPAWCDTGASLEVNGSSVESALAHGSYATVRRAWRPGDVVRLRIPMAPRRVSAHPSVIENTGRIALMRGPLLYCLEGIDHPGCDLRHLVLPTSSIIETNFQPDHLGGIVTLDAHVQIVTNDASWNDCLYRPAPGAPTPPAMDTALLTAIPYHAWANREPGPMQVWLRSPA